MANELPAVPNNIKKWFMNINASIGDQDGRIVSRQEETKKLLLSLTATRLLIVHTGACGKKITACLQHSFKT